MREYFCAYHSMLSAMRKLSDAECGRLFRALLAYSSGLNGGSGEEPINLQGREELLFDVFCQQIDRDSQSYAKKCERNRENVNKRYQTSTNVDNGIPPSTTTYQNYQDKDKEEEKDKDKEKEKTTKQRSHAATASSRFTSPTVEMVEAYCKERNNGVDAQNFCDFYTSKGWKVGNQSMKDWKSAVRTWERNDRSYSSPSRPATPKAAPKKTEKSDEPYDWHVNPFAEFVGGDTNDASK